MSLGTILNRAFYAHLCLLSSLILPVPLAAGSPAYLHEGPILIENVTIIDGLGNLPNPMRDLLLLNGRIEKISSTGHIGELPAHTRLIDGTGLTVMPGLMDLHIHVQNLIFDVEEFGSQAGPIEGHAKKTLNALLYAGVTSILEIGNEHDFIVKLRDDVAEGRRMGPTIYPVGEIIHRLHTVKGVASLPTLETQAEIKALLDQREEAGFELVKIYNGVSPWEARHLTAAAKRRDMRVVADYWCSNMSRTLFEVTGISGYAHGACRELTHEEAQWMAANDKFAMLTLTAFDYMGGHRAYRDYPKRGFLDEPLIVDPLGREMVSDYYKNFTAIREVVTEGEHSFFQAQLFGDMTHLLPDNQKNAKKLHEAGVLIGLGTDANWPPGNFPGDALHHELLLHAQAGIAPVEVIQMATSNAARILKIEDQVGSIEKGKVADLVLVEGNPGNDISKSRDVVYVIKRGKLVNRDALKVR
jgi:imidazolonepropionase-like amidohydrolase